MTGEDSCLIPPVKNKRKMFPDSVTTLAQEHWLEITVPEPAKHHRPETATADGGDFLPVLYQPMTDQEAYDSFIEASQIKVTDAMKKHSQERMEEVAQWPESDDKRRRLQYLTSEKPIKFPGELNIFHIKLD